MWLYVHAPNMMHTCITYSFSPLFGHAVSRMIWCDSHNHLSQKRGQDKVSYEIMYRLGKVKV